MSRDFVEGPTEDGMTGVLSGFLSRITRIAGKASVVEEEASVLEADMQNFVRQKGSAVEHRPKSRHPNDDRPDAGCDDRPALPASAISARPGIIPREFLRDCGVQIIPPESGKGPAKLRICMEFEIPIRDASAEMVGEMVANYRQTEDGRPKGVKCEKFMVAAGLQGIDEKKFRHTFDGWINRLRDDLEKVGIPRDFVQTARNLGVWFWW